MSPSEYFRCPACRAKLKFGKRPKARVTCPSCGHQFDYEAAPEGSDPHRSPSADANGELGTTAAFGMALMEATKESARAEGEDQPELIEDEFDDEDRSEPEYRPLAHGSKAKKKPAANAGTFTADEKSSSASTTHKLSPVAVGLTAAAALMVLVLITVGLALVRNSGRAAKFEPPQKYVPLEVAFIIPLAGTMPEGWKSTSGGGGRDGPPIWVKISDGGSISIEIRESFNLKMVQAAAGRRASSFPISEVHEYFRAATKNSFSNYEEGPERPIATEGFDALISDFSGKEGMFGVKVKGCRASLVQALHQYNVVCKCPAAQFEDVKPVFEKIISSLGTGEKR